MAAEAIPPIKERSLAIIESLLLKGPLRGYADHEEEEEEDRDEEEDVAAAAATDKNSSTLSLVASSWLEEMLDQKPFPSSLFNNNDIKQSTVHQDLISGLVELIEAFLINPDEMLPNSYWREDVVDVVQDLIDEHPFILSSNKEQQEQQKTAGDVCVAFLHEDSSYHVALLEGEKDDEHWRIRFIEFQNLIRDLSKDNVKFPEELTQESLLQYNLEGEVDGDDAGVIADKDGVCLLCKRSMQTTLHHMIPKSVHQRRDEPRSFLLGKENILICCRPCHSCIHRAENNATLAKEYYTQELIMSHSKIRSFVEWVSKQSTARYKVKPRKK